MNMDVVIPINVNGLSNTKVLTESFWRTPSVENTV